MGIMLFLYMKARRLENHLPQRAAKSEINEYEYEVKR